MQMTYLGDEQLPEGDSVFGINSFSLTADYTTTIAAFVADVNGTTVSTAKYYLDFNNVNTVAWNTECERSSFTGYGSGKCSTAPVNTKSLYDSSDQQTLYQTFENE
jgi:hypothetical protein